MYTETGTNSNWLFWIILFIVIIVVIMFAFAGLMWVMYSLAYSWWTPDDNEYDGGDDKDNCDKNSDDYHSDVDIPSHIKHIITSGETIYDVFSTDSSSSSSSSGDSSSSSSSRCNSSSH